MEIPTYEDVVAASRRVEGRVVRTPLLRNARLDELTQATVLVKAEPLQRTGSFKLRGATNATLLLTEAQRQAGLVTHSSGNHGQAVACAAASLGVPATIFMPADAPRVKVESTRRWGGDIVLYDRLRENREELSAMFAARTGASLVPPYDHPHVIAGQGTLGLEMAEDARMAELVMDALLVCTGGGGLISGCALALSGASTETKLFAVEPEGWDDTARSLSGGRRVPNAPGGSLLCDALLSPMPGELTFQVNQAYLSGAMAVSDAEVLDAMRFAFTDLKLVVEPGGAVALAALLCGRFEAKGQVVGIVLSGGNVDPIVFGRALAA